jgi:hypothetical protein
MGKLVGRFMIAMLLAATFISGVEPKLMPAAAHGLHGAASAHAHDGQSDHFSKVAMQDHQSSDDGHPRHQHPAHGCSHADTHCCSSFALLTNGCVLKVSAQVREVRFDFDAAVTLGQLSYPPRRPPRAVA